LLIAHTSTWFTTCIAPCFLWLPFQAWNKTHTIFLLLCICSSSSLSIIIIIINHHLLLHCFFPPSFLNEITGTQTSFSTNFGWYLHWVSSCLSFLITGTQTSFSTNFGSTYTEFHPVFPF
jgi:hypothetical protein